MLCIPSDLSGFSHHSIRSGASFGCTLPIGISPMKSPLQDALSSLHIGNLLSVPAHTEQMLHLEAADRPSSAAPLDISR